MLTSNTLAAAFGAARQKQAELHNTSLTPVATAVGKAVLRASSLAMDDVEQDLQGRAFRVVSAPTGSGKSLGAAALIAAAYRTDPAFTCAYVVETVALADEMGAMIGALIGNENVTVWTTAHDAGASDYKRADLEADYGPLKMPLHVRRQHL
jgi:hypothetical protein